MGFAETLLTDDGFVCVFFLMLERRWAASIPRLTMASSAQHTTTTQTRASTSAGLTQLPRGWPTALLAVFMSDAVVLDAVRAVCTIFT